MNELERTSQRPTVSEAPLGFGGDSPDPLDDMAANLLRAADAAVARALSTNSQAYLQHMRQDGGQ